MREADFHRVTASIIESKQIGTCAVELKLVKSGNFLKSQVPPHQVKALKQVKSRGLFYKIPDAGYDQKPFDAFYLQKQPAFVVVIFYIPRKVKNIYFIDIDDFILWEKKSLTLEECSSLALYQVVL